MKTGAKPSAIYCRFVSPGEPLALRIQPAALTALKQTILEAEAGGTAAAGFLLGITEPAAHGEGRPPVIAIEGFVPLRGEPGSDSFALELRSHSYRREGWPVGFFRAKFASDAVPAEEDVKLMAGHFGPAGIFLLITGTQGRYAGTFYTLYTLDASEGETLRATYPISLDGLSSGMRWPEPGRVAPPQRYPAGLVPEGVPGRVPARRWSAARIGLVLGTIAVLALGAIEYRTLMLLNQQQQPREAPDTSGGLDLRTERGSADNQWRIFWNRSSAVIRKAARGHISILDGQLRKEIDLAADDLRNGSIVYAPFADDVSFRLEVFDPQAGRAFSESIRVLANPWPDSSPASIYNRIPASESSLVNVPARAGESRPKEPRRADPPSSAERSSPPPREFIPPATAKGPVVVSRSVNDLPAPPSLQGRAAPAGDAPAAVAAVVPAMPEPDAPAPALPKTYAAEPAKLLHRVDPQYPRMAEQIRLAGTVRIEATVGTDGRVYNARVVSGHPVLSEAALQAVRQWTYTPASINGRPVNAQTTVEVRFGPR